MGAFRRAQERNAIGSLPFLSVVIPCRNGAARLQETIASIESQQLGGGAEILVVDDGSDDATPRVAAPRAVRWGELRAIRHEEPRGRAAACNTGIEAARGRVVLILDDDMTLRPGALESHRRFHESFDRAAAVGRIALEVGVSPRGFVRYLIREQEVRERRLLAERRHLTFPDCLTGHFSASREVLLECGGFDTSITRYGFEDIELGFRLQLAGVRLVYVPEAESLHRAFMTDLDRYLARHYEAGVVARQLATRYAEGPFRDYLRVDGPRRLGVGRDPAGLVGLRLANRLLLRRPFRAALGSRPGFGAFRRVLRGLEAIGFDRAAHFGYHVARDVRYFQGYFGEAVSE